MKTKNKKLFKKILNDMKKLKNSDYIVYIQQLNSYDNIKYFSKKGINMKELFIECIKEMLKRKIKIPSKGFYDLISFAKDKKK